MIVDISLNLFIKSKLVISFLLDSSFSLVFPLLKVSLKYKH